MNKRNIVGILSVCFSLNVSGQTDDLLESLDPDQVSEEPEELELIQWLQEHPIDLNAATMESLRSVPGLTEQDAISIIAYRSGHGPFSSTDELAQVPGMTSETADWLRGITMVSPPERTHSPLRIDLRARTMRDLQVRQGFSRGTYAGSPDKSYLRLSGTKANAGEAGILVEKDSGEPARAGFVSAYALGDLGGTARIVLGDFHFESGQGLVFWQGSGFGKGGRETGERKPRGIVPHRSADEFNFLRGVGASSSISFRRFGLSLSGFYSNRQLPATTDTSGTVTSFFESGTFRTESELEKRSAIREQLIGGNILAEWESGFSCGVTGYAFQFDRLIDGRASSGEVVGVNAGLLSGDTEVAGEVALGSNSGISCILRGARRFGRLGSLVMIYRNYSSDPAGWHASGFGESADTRNEQGLYLGIHFRPMNGVMTSMFIDHFHFPRRTSTIPVPSQGHDAGITLESRPAAHSELIARVTWSRGQDLVLSPGRHVVDHDQYRLRLTFVHEPHRSLRFKTRIETTRIPGDPDSESGLMLFQDVRITPSADLACEARIIFFHTDSYDSRIYEFENDVRGVYSTPPLFGLGKRWYLLLRYELLPDATLSAKFSETQKEGVRSVGTGAAEIPGDTESRMVFQIDLRL